MSAVPTSVRVIALAGLLGPALHAPSAAAETWATCTGYIASVPAVVSSQGTWCLSKDLGTAASTGAAITVASNNVTIDCNGYKLGNLAAGTGTLATGILSDARRNVTLRNCHIRGFATGIHLTGAVSPQVTSSGHVVEDLVVEGSTMQGIVVKGRDSVIRRTRVLDIGANPQLKPVAGIGAIGTVDVVDNLVDGVVSAPGSIGPTWGIYAEGVDGIVIARNRVRDFLPASGFGYGIFYVGTEGTMASIRGNAIFRTDTNTLWIRCTPGYLAMARDNAAMGWTSGSSNCYEFEEIETW